MHKHDPKLRQHKHSGHAVVTLNGRDHYLGRYGSAESREAYHRLLTQWHANSRQIITPKAETNRSTARPAALTVKRLVLDYWHKHAKPYYRKPGGISVCVASRPRFRAF